MEKLYTVLLISVCLISFKNYSSYAENTPSSILKIKIDELDEKLTVGQKQVFIVYRDTVSYFDEQTYEEAFQVTEITKPIEILEVE